MFDCIVVEDDPFWLAEITKALARSEVRVLPAGDGREALKLAQQNPAAGMILDIILPEMDGVEVLLQLQSVAPSMPVLAVTGGGRVGADFYLRLAHTFGAKARLAKPFTAEQLLENWHRLAA